MQAAEPTPTTAPQPTSRRRIGPAAALELHAGIGAFAGLVCTLLWGLTDSPSFWPLWVWFAIVLSLALHAGCWLGWTWWRRARDRRHGLIAAHAAVSLTAIAILLLVWVASGPGGEFWPLIPVACLGGLLAGHALGGALWVRFDARAREETLTTRVDELTRSRRGVVEAQAEELRRVERDLHDGAQSRLVALTMQLGLAEAELSDRPEAAAKVRAAREEAGAAIAELRDLARGIAPPVLADRGLAAAVESLADRASGPVTVEAAGLDRRPPPVVESAAYFVVAEALTNVAKHAPGAAVAVTLSLDGAGLRVAVRDDGPGGADPHGSGIAGLLGRVEALDGRLGVSSPPGAGTTIEAELPC